MNKDHYIITEHAGKTQDGRSTYSVKKQRANGRVISYDKQFNSKQIAYRNIAANVESDLVMLGMEGVSTEIKTPEIIVHFTFPDVVGVRTSFKVTERLLAKTKRK
jgi:hypothetical protein